MFVKICGTTSEEDALLAVAMGADAVGFIFAPSPRQIAPAVAADIVKRLPHGIVTVGVFRDELPERVVSVCQAAGLGVAQLHGRETPEHTRWVRARVGQVFKAFPAGSPLVADSAAYGADAIMLDAPHPGSGQVFDWALAQEVPVGQPLIVAGGLTAGNVAGAVARTRPWGVDVVTGVEAAPGRKDPVKLREFIAAARAAEPAAHQPRGAGPYDWQEE
ncbi:MAG TPA: phosphoribosylanthranilate isomerase [Acidimicrobiales bacterium]|nr:phosphoribosylanthranilate isomerase [Acidimicrobiales bacterium]